MLLTKSANFSAPDAESVDLYWTRVPGQIDRARDLLMVRADSFKRAQELLGNPSIPVTLCTTPELVAMAEAHAVGEVFPVTVQRLPSVYDVLGPANAPGFMNAAIDAGFDLR